VITTNIVNECLAAENEINQKVNNELLPALRRYQTTGSREHLASFAGYVAETHLCICDVSDSFDLPLVPLVAEITSGNSSQGRECFEIMMEHMTKKEMGERYSVKGMVS
jgi:hypothetical protein